MYTPVHTNKNLIVDIIRKEGPISRADIAKRLCLSKPSVSNNVAELLKAGIVMEVGPGNNSIEKSQHSWRLTPIKHL
jgi:DNA-binding Lrp family transcriptional regulator